MEDPSILTDPKTLFHIFTNNRGTLGFEEFANIFKQLGLKVSHAQMLSIFSEVDTENKGELNYQNFINSMKKLENILIREIMEQLGISLLHMAISFAFSILLLLLMLVFIFVGIGAFSPDTAFSSVTNSILPLAAGLAVNKKSRKREEEEEEIVNA